MSRFCGELEGAAMMKFAACALLSFTMMSCASVPPEASSERAGAPATSDLIASPPIPIIETPAYSSALAAIGDLSQSRYVEQNCAMTTVPDAAYAGFDVKRCIYYERDLMGVVYVLSPAAEEIARWVANACAAIDKSNDESCGSLLVASMRRSNGFIFPVAGDVLEPASSAGPGCAARHGNKLVHVYFRDGITVETERDYTCETYEISEADADAEAFKAPVKVFNVGRIAAIHRDDYARFAGIPRPSDDEWRTIVRESYLQALKTGRYSLLELRAKNVDWNAF